MVMALIQKRIIVSSEDEKNILKNFHQLYYDSMDLTWRDTYWLGFNIYKCPLDCWIYQEIMFKVKPDIIIETGTFFGGSALYLASLCDILKNGEVITIDIAEQKGRPLHNRITYLTGSSISSEIINIVERKINKSHKVMVFLDSDHQKDHVLKEMIIYSKFVSEGSYLIVEDSNINDHPVYPDFGPGPMEAIDEFLKGNKNFIVDKKMEKFFLTFNPRGYLLRIK